MFVAYEALRLVRELPIFAGILLEVHVFVTALIEYELWLVNFPREYNLVHLVTRHSADALSCLGLVYNFVL